MVLQMMKTSCSILIKFEDVLTEVSSKTSKTAELNFIFCAVHSAALIPFLSIGKVKEMMLPFDQERVPDFSNLRTRSIKDFFKYKIRNF